MPVNIDLTIDDRAVRELLAGLQAKLNRMQPAMSVIGEIALESIQRNFEVGGRPDKWAPLSEGTKARRAANKKWPGQILVVTGALKSIVYQATEDGVTLSAHKKGAAVMHFGAKRGEFGSVTATVGAHVRKLASGKTSKVRAHTRRQVMPWGDIPARPFMVIQEEDWTEMVAALSDYLAVV